MRCPAWILCSRSFRTTPSPSPHATASTSDIFIMSKPSATFGVPNQQWRVFWKTEEWPALDTFGIPQRFPDAVSITMVKGIPRDVLGTQEEKETSSTPFADTAKTEHVSEAAQSKDKEGLEANGSRKTEGAYWDHRGAKSHISWHQRFKGSYIIHRNFRHVT